LAFGILLEWGGFPNIHDIDIMNRMIDPTSPRVSSEYRLSSELLTYLVERNLTPGQRLPSIDKLAGDLEISVGKLREQLEVARELGLVDIKPKVGITVNPFSFFHSIRTALRYAINKNPGLFSQIGELRNKIEAAFWWDAVSGLEQIDKQYLCQLVERAREKLEGEPIQIPHLEHRELHLTIFSKVDNIFVRGFMEAYWDAYEAIGLNVYADFAYLKQVWEYHSQMVEAINLGDFDRGHRILVKHTELISQRKDHQASS
jgi:DNA-binding FadR family transcriptional regulator